MNGKSDMLSNMGVLDYERIPKLYRRLREKDCLYNVYRGTWKDMRRPDEATGREQQVSDRSISEQTSQHK